MLRSDLMALVRKYRWLEELRRAQVLPRRAGPEPPLQQLASEFPGALRELDALPLTSIAARIAAIEHAMAAGAVEPWMEWMHHYHAEMRAALSAKRLLAGRRDVEAGVLLQICACVRDETGYSCDPEFVRGVARPPEGRLTRLVVVRLSEHFRVTQATLREALLPELHG